MLFGIQRSLAFSPSSFFIVCLLACFAAPLSAKTVIFDAGGSARSKAVPERSGVQVPEDQQGKSYSTAAPASGNANAELFFMIEQLKQEVSELRGIVEQQSFRLNNMEQSGKRRYQDLDTRVLNLTKEISAQGKPVNVGAAKHDSAQGVVPARPPVATPKVGSEPTEEQKQEYAKAYALVKDKKFAEAVDALHAYIEKYPEGELTGNAYYWLGEVYLVLPKLEQAKQSFMIVVKTFPGHRKVADAMFKLAVSFDRLHDPENSEKYLELVQRNYPDSTAAKLAKNYKIVR